MDIDNDYDIEYELENIKNFGNEKQLYLLGCEIEHICTHGLQVSEGWYDERFEYINMYSQLGWFHLAERFNDKDVYLYNTAIHTIRLLDGLLEERGSKPNFNLNNYYNMIHNIQSIWNYYKKIYGSNEDNDILDLIEGMKFLCKD